MTNHLSFEAEGRGLQRYVIGEQIDVGITLRRHVTQVFNIVECSMGLRTSARDVRTNGGQRHVGHAVVVVNACKEMNESYTGDDHQYDPKCFNCFTGDLAQLVFLVCSLHAQIGVQYKDERGEYCVMTRTCWAVK